ncbi:MAG: SDR family oxidoreductase [Rhabdochlamydiaceae bacterium]
MKERTILLTGATGALGSLLLSRLLAEGHKVVCLVREKGEKSPRDRIHHIIKNHMIDVIRGDIREPRCGISALDYELWKQGVGVILHCAASVAFDSQKETYAANVEGVRNVLDLADTLGVCDFRHVSTAYVAGDASRFSESDLYVAQRWRNTYENTKYVGETMVRAWALQDERQFAIYRPSILIGCADGTTPAFNGIYSYLQVVQAVTGSLRRRLEIGEPIPFGQFLLVSAPNATINLVPIDWVADTIVQLLKAPARNTTFHLVHPNPPRVQWAAQASLQALNIRDTVIVHSQEVKCQLQKNQPALIARLQAQIDRVHTAYLPYVTGEAVFVAEKAKLILKNKFERPPKIDKAYLDRMLRFAVTADWGNVRVRHH